jgi:hypothetical protein
LDVKGTILNIAPVSTKYLSFVNWSVRKMRPPFAGKCMAVSVACVEFAAKPVRVRRHFSFQKRSWGKWTCVLCCVKRKKRGSPKNCRKMLPGKSKEQGNHRENSTKETNVHKNKTNQNGVLP